MSKLGSCITLYIGPGRPLEKSCTNAQPQTLNSNGYKEGLLERAFHLIRLCYFVCVVPIDLSSPKVKGLGFGDEGLDSWSLQRGASSKAKP